MSKKKTELSTKEKQPVKIRYKKLANGNLSIYLDIYQNGKRNYKFLKLYLVPETNEKAKAINRKNMDLAEAIKAQMIIQLNTTIHGLSNQKESSKILLRDYIRSFAETKGKSTQQNLNSLVYHLERSKGTDIQIGKADKYYIMDFIEYLEDAQIEHTQRNKGRKLSKNSQAMYFKCLKMVLDEAVSDDIIPLNPILSIKKKYRPSAEKAPKREFLTEDELRRFAGTDHPNELLKRAFMIGCLTGLRHCDIKQMKWGNIGVVKNGIECISLVQEKTNDPVDIPLNENIRKWLPEQGNASMEDLVFSGLITLGRSNEILPKWAEKAGINKHLTFHCSRHTFAVLAIAKKVDIYTVSKLLGHQSITVTEIYTEVLDNSKKEAMEAIGKINV